MFIRATTNAEALSRRIQDTVARQIPFAAASALTDVAKKVREAERAEMARVFDRPTPFTLNSLMVVPARKDTLLAIVTTKTPATGRHYLPVETQGGNRPAQGFESKLRALSPVPFGAAIPARAAQRDAFGNWTASERARVLSALQTQGPLRASGTFRSGRATEYYIGQRGTVTGVFRRKGDDDDLILLLTQDTATYRAALDFVGVAERTFGATWEPAFGAAMQRALASAR